MAHVHQLSIFRRKPLIRQPSFKHWYEEDYDGEEEKDEDEVNSQGPLHWPSRNSPSGSSTDVSEDTYASISRNVVDYVQRREQGSCRVRPIAYKQEQGTRHILDHSLLREVEIPLKSVNKIFCAKWLSDRQVVLGTKCNQLLAIDLVTLQSVKIPSLRSSEKSVPPDIPCGIHSIQMNPSSTLLATGAYNSNDVAVYQLPTLDPVCVGEGAHKDWIFDIVWLDDQFFLSGSRDTKIALWRVDQNSSEPEEGIPRHSFMSPLVVRKCKMAEKVRALSFNYKYQEFAALSLNAYLHIWDLHTFRQKLSVRLPHCLENVCMATTTDYSLYAVGSKSYLTLHDSRTLRRIQQVSTRVPGCSIRSITFNNNIVTLGTGIGILMFYDCRAGKYLEFSGSGDSSAEMSGSFDLYPIYLQTSPGWVCPEDDLYRQAYQGMEYEPAIYTHCYDPSGTKLFAAGGPLPASLYGSYAGLWQ